MPIYEYVCPDCKQPFEKLVSGGSKEKPVHCPICGQDSQRKKVTLVASVNMGGSLSLASSAAACAPSG
jgi:putative FmdB family regulatory protein